MKKRKNYYHPYEGRRKRRWLLALLAAALACVLAYAVLLGAVLLGAHDQVRGTPGAMIVLGCQVRQDGPSVLLQDRLDKALGYWQDHEEILIVVSGGQGPDEHISEAQCMYDYLTARGVPGESIRLEDRSHNTDQNLRYSVQLLAEEGYDPGGGVVVVSNGFHLARVRMLWPRAAGGESELSTLAAPSSHVPSRLAMYLREPFALVKSFVFDR